MLTGINQIDFLFNILVMLFWIHIWNPKPVSLIPNTYTEFVENLTCPVLNLLQPITGNKTVSALLALAILIVFRAMAFPGPAQTNESINWTIQIGFTTLTPTAFTAGAKTLFSALSFIVFLFHVWAFEMLMGLAYKGRKPENGVSEFVSRVTYPFSLVKHWLKTLVLLTLGITIIILMDSAATGITPDFTTTGKTLRFFISALAGIVNTLQLMIHIMIGMIIASWIGLLTNSTPVMAASREWLDFIIGPVLRKFKLQIGMFDLTPLLVLFGLDFAHRIIITLLLIPYLTIQ